MKKLLMIAGILVLAVIWSSPAMAHRDWREGYGHGPGRIPDITTAPGLGLSAEQREKIGDLRTTHLKDIKPLQDELHVKGRELRHLWLEETPDKGKILSLQGEVQRLRNQMMDKITGHFLAVQKILTPEQRAKIRAYGPGHRMGPRDGSGMGSAMPHAPRGPLKAGRPPEGDRDGGRREGTPGITGKE